MARYCTSVWYFPRAVGEGKYYTRVQCLAILPSHECNDSILSPSSVALIVTAKQSHAYRHKVQLAHS